MVESTSPLTITWEPVSFVGFNKIGFMRTDGSIPAASACMTCARPISRPSLVIKEFSAIFCDLKGATRYPSCLNILHSPAASRLLPAFDMVPCTIIDFAILLTLSLLQFLQCLQKCPVICFSPHCDPVKTFCQSIVISTVAYHKSGTIHPCLPPNRILSLPLPPGLQAVVFSVR